MLVLTRKIDEEIRISDNITIKVLGIRGASVRLGIQAPSDVKILRKELDPLLEVDDDHTTPTTAASRELGTVSHSRCAVSNSRMRITNPGTKVRSTLSLLSEMNANKLRVS